MSNWKKLIVSGSGAHLASVTASKFLADSITFTTTSGISVGVGELAWNNSDGTLDLGMKGGNVVQQIGQEIFYEVRNDTGDVIENGTAVYESGVTVGSGRIIASPFTADGSVREVRFLGLATEDINNGVNGFVTNFGYVRGLDTRGTEETAISVGDEDWQVGDVLYAHPTVAGKLTNIQPKHKIYVAILIVRHQNVGVLFVRPSSYGHIDDIHDVSISTGSLSSGDLLVYDASSDDWKNSKQLTGSYGLTGSLQATSFTGSLQGTATTASYILNAVSSSFATNSNTASYVLNAVSSSFATTASYLLGGGVSISGPTTDIVNYSGITHYMLVYNGTTNDITGSHLLTINPGNETLDVQVGIEMQGGAPISTAGSISANSGFNVGLNTWTGNNIYATASYAATASRVSTLNQNVTISGSVFLSGSLHTPVFVDYEEKYTTINHSSAGSITYDLSLGNIFYVNQTANITLSTITNPPTATNLGSFTVILDSDATYTVAWPASVEWTEVPNLDNGPAINILSFITPNGGTDWYGFIGGLGYNNV